jgi:hypothetical protein
MMTSSTRAFAFAELQIVTSLGRGEIRECVKRGIISAPAGVGQGNHRAYSKWNLVEGVIAAALLRHVRAGSVEVLMKHLRGQFFANDIDPEAYCAAPLTFAFRDFAVHYPPRTKPDEKADRKPGEDRGTDEFLITTARATRDPHHGPSVTADAPSAPFCQIPIDLEKAVQFVNYMIKTRLQDL